MESDDLLDNASMDDEVTCSSSPENCWFGDIQNKKVVDPAMDTDSYNVVEGDVIEALLTVTENSVCKEEKKAEFPPERKKEKPLSGTASKRFKNLLQRGFDREEARRVAQIPRNPAAAPAKTAKRSRGLDSSNCSEEKPLPKKQKGPSL